MLESLESVDNLEPCAVTCRNVQVYFSTTYTHQIIPFGCGQSDENRIQLIEFNCTNLNCIYGVQHYKYSKRYKIFVDSKKIFIYQ